MMEVRQGVLGGRPVGAGSWRQQDRHKRPTQVQHACRARREQWARETQLEASETTGAVKRT